MGSLKDEFYDQQDELGDKALAKALGIGVSELDELNYEDIDSDESSDGLVYSYYIEIQRESSSEEILDKVIANTDCTEYDDYVTVYLSPSAFEDDGSDDEYHSGEDQSNKGNNQLELPF